MHIPYDKLTESEKWAFHHGQETIINQAIAIIAELEESRNLDSSYGRGQLYILREFIRRFCDE